jgi:hypothetical protein
VQLTLTSSYRCLCFTCTKAILPSLDGQDRYEPMPGLLALPGHFLRKLSPRGRRITAAVAMLLLAGAVAATVVLVPKISESKRERAATERRARAEAAAQQRARLVAEQRPRHGRANVSAEGAAVTTAVERAITRDVRERATRGELDNPARRTDCRTTGRDGRRLLLACTAVTSEVATSEKTSGVVVGYSYSAAGSPASGRFAFCKTAHAAMGFSERGLPEVRLPRACGG